MTKSHEEFRLLIDPPLDGAANMARDESLLLIAGDDSHPASPVLRLYQWEPATVSLGYFQTLDEVRAQPSPIRDMPVVRRLTGGGAIVHHDELTYSLVLPASHPLVQSGPMPLYLIVHAAAIDMLASFRISAQCVGCGGGAGGRHGPFLCFDRRHPLDVVVGSRKVVGSAQRRSRTAVLQHGSLQLGPLRGLGHLPPCPADWAQPFADAVAARLQARPIRVEWWPDALRLAGHLQARYADPHWNACR